MQTSWDAIVVGAGPAGMACAIALAEHALQVLVLDEQPAPGGQLYRNIERQPETAMQVLGIDYARGAGLVQRFRHCGAAYHAGAVVWKLENAGRVCFSRNGTSYEVQAKRVVIATGAMERPVPFTGWTLPGVMSAGGADGLCKSAGVLPEGPVALAGSGPLLLLVAKHLRAAGVKVHCVLESTPLRHMGGALAHLPAALRRTDYLLQGAGMLAGTMRHAEHVVTNVHSYSVQGDGKVTGISAAHGMRGRRQSQFSVSTVLVHEGIIPRTEFSRQLRLVHAWDDVQRCWHPQVDAYGRTSSPCVYMTGDGAFVRGGVAAALQGELSGLAVACDVGAVAQHDILSRSKAVRKMLHRELAPRPFVDSLYRPRKSLYDVPDDVYVCRCEGVTAGAIRAAVADGQTVPDMVKSITRCGMGPCQGRMCMSGVAELVSTHTGIPAEKLALPTVRPPVRHLPLAELATMTLLDAPERQAACSTSGAPAPSVPHGSPEPSHSSSVPDSLNGSGGSGRQQRSIQHDTL